MRCIVLGDIHGDWEIVNQIMKKEDASLFLSTGDVSDANYEYETPNHPLWAICGNHENWDIIEGCKHNTIRIGNLNFIFPNKVYEINEIRFGGLGGNFSPKYFSYTKPELPHPVGKKNRNGKADKRRHFVQEEVKECKKFVDLDIFLTHEAPSFYSEHMRWSDHGCGNIIDDLIKNIRPKIHVWGHHHSFALGKVFGVVSIGMPYPKKAYLKLDFEKNEWELKNNGENENETTIEHGVF